MRRRWIIFFALSRDFSFTERGRSPPRVLAAAFPFSVLRQMVQVGAMLVVSQLIDSVKNVLRLSAFSTLFQIGMYLALILLCVFNDITLTLKYTLVFSAGIFTNIIQKVI